MVSRKRVSEVTVSESVLGLLHSLGIRVSEEQWVVSECAGLARMFYNFVLSNEEFMELMRSAENYRQDLHIKKTEKLLGTILEREITFGKVERDLISKSFQEIDKFKESFLSSRPAVWLPTYCLLPHVYFERKKIHKIIISIQKNLKEVAKQIGGVNREQLNKFFIIYFLMGVAKTSPKKIYPSRSKTQVDTETVGPSVGVGKVYQPCFDIVGLRFYRTHDYVEMSDFVIPPKSLIISYCTE